MIEVEQKFLLKAGDRERLVEGAQLVGERTIVDTLYDTATYALTRQDWWPRQRDGVFELKVLMQVPGQTAKQRLTGQFEEIIDEALIRQKLNLPAIGSLDEALAQAGIGPFVRLVTTRTSYRLSPFTIDLDQVDFGYAVAEIELMVRSQDEMTPAVEAITAFAEARGLRIEPVLGKALEYLKRHRPEHFQALVTSGVVPAAYLR